MNILLFGAGYFPYLTAGEKNFFYRLIPILDEHANITIASLNDYPESVLTQDSNHTPIQVYCLKRPLHKNYEKFYFENSNYIAYHHRHKPVREVVEKLVSVLAHTPKIRKIIKQHEIQIIHFMDNFGPSMPYIKSIFRNVKVTYSAANYDPRGRKKRYDQYLQMSLKSLDAIGVYTESYRNILMRIGIKVPMFLTRWGVSHAQDSLSADEKKNIRASLGIESGAIFLLWSGYLQQIQEVDFYLAIEVARKIVNENKNIVFMFAFKPESYRDKYGLEDGDRIKITSRLANFGDVLETADFFFSPILDTTSTVSPPLTWIEAMSKGTPIITTKIPGVAELIDDGINGFIAENYGDLPVKVRLAIQNTDQKTLENESIRKVYKEFNIQKSAESYLGMWGSVLKNG